MIITLGLLAGLIGLGIALYIYSKQNAQKPLMCPRRAPCETVLSSPQSKTFGFSNTILGIMYYILVLVVLSYISAYPGGLRGQIVFIILTSVGFIFSLYLVWVQQTKIKQWCVWCLGSALMATILFVVSILLL